MCAQACLILHLLHRLTLGMRALMRWRPDEHQDAAEFLGKLMECLQWELVRSHMPIALPACQTAQALHFL